MEINGTIKTVLPVVTGMTKKGTSWAAQQYILQSEDGKTSILLEVFGQDNIDRLSITEGEAVAVTFNPEVSEFKGHYFGKNRILDVVRDQPTVE